jgi:Cytochrome b5-like Heme/Steroid binding domain
MNIQVERRFFWIWQVHINAYFLELILVGKDATDAFEDVGHSDEAREILAGLIKGDLERRVLPIFVAIC